MAKKNEDVKSLDGRVLPNNFEAEQAVLGCALIDGEAALMAISRLSEEEFYNETHKSIFKAIRELFKKSATIDFVTVSDELEKNNLIAAVGGMAYISSLTSIVPSSAGCSNYIEIVRKNSVLRQVILASGNIIEKAYANKEGDNIVGIAEKAIYDIAERGQTSALEPIEKPLSTVISRLEEVYKDNSVLRGVRTGFYQIDKMTNGLQKSDLIILAARPGVGKTSLAMNIVSNAALQTGAKCAVFSLEMSKEQLTQRMLCSIANVSMAKALRGEIKDTDWVKLHEAETKLKSANIFIDDNSGNTPSQILQKARKLKREKGLDLIVIDYLGLMKSDERTENRQNEVANISRELKKLAREINVPVLTLCQLNRSVEQRADGKPGRPTLSDLRDSGAIEQDADMVWFIHRDMTRKEVEENKSGDYKAEIIIAKFRNGEPGSVWLDWDGSRTTFVNPERDANMQSLADTYERNQAAKKENKQVYNTAEDFKEAVDSIATREEIEAMEELAPPPEEYGDEIPDYSDVSVPGDDELF
ncbi:MAG: replicative DNA helicase [Clostridia bacterium]|nr:replicative DNA helicase [Clostridia bacterium]